MRIFELSLAFLIGQVAAAAGSSATSEMHVRLVGSGLVQHLENYTKPLSIRQQPVTSGGFGKSGTPTDEITSVRTGILYNDDNQTYCEVLMSSQTVGVAAASCFDYVNNEVDPNVSYSVIVSSGTNSTGISGTFKATKVTPHPEYDPTTYANNVAVMQFMAIPGSEFTKQIADWPAEWKQYYMVHRSLTNVMPYVFNAPKVSAIDVGSTPSGCTDASAIYAANADDYICNMVTIESYLNSNCVAPFGSVYGDADPYPANLAALFSHSAIYGTGSYCGQGPFYNYYLILRNYIPWIQSVAQTDISTYHIETSTSYTAATNVSYVMQNPTTQASGVVVVGNYTTQEASSSEIERVSALFVSASEDMDFPTSDVLASNVSPEVNIVTSTDMVSSTVVVSTTATISETTTLEATDVVSQTSTILTTSTVLATSTTVELSIMTITATDIVPTAIGATNSIISPVIVYVTDMSILTVGGGQVGAETVTEQETITVFGNSDGLDAMDGETTTVTETVTAATNTVYVTNTVTESAPVVTSVSTVTFTDLGFITITTTDTLVSTVATLSTTSASSSSPVPTSSSALSTYRESSSVDDSSSEDNANKDNKGIPLWMIILLAVMCLALFILFVWFILYRRRIQREKEQQEMLAFGAPMQLPTRYRAVNWLNDRIWGKSNNEKEAPPDYIM